MASYTLTGPQQTILTSWLYEDGGYLDSVENTSGVTAREALVATPGLDITAWVRTNSPSVNTDPTNWSGVALVWWMRSQAGVNITPPTRPPETTAWVTILQSWGVSIDAALANTSEAVRNQKAVIVTAEDGTTSTIPGGAHLVHQRNLITNVLGVLT